MTDKERFLFDLNGYLMLEDVLTSEEVAAANQAIDRHSHLLRDRRLGLAHTSKRPQGLDRQGRVHARPLGL